jgi:hypothetical protein
MPDDPAARGEPQTTDPATPRRTFTFKKTFTFGRPPPDDPNLTVIPGETRSFKWQWGGNDPAIYPATDQPTDPATKSAPGPDLEPATYYEVLTGRPDPNRDFFVNARRVINFVVWMIALGLPIGLVTLGIVVGADLQTIVLMGLAGLVVGFMFKTSFPRTPFG